MALVLVRYVQTPRFKEHVVQWYLASAEGVLGGTSSPWSIQLMCLQRPFWVLLYNFVKEYICVSINMHIHCLLYI